MKYNMTLEDFRRMESDQGGVCKICGKPESRRNKKGELMPLHVDHCHSTNAVRGLLCHSCNTAIGHFGDDIRTLESAINYLKSHTVSTN